MTMGTSSRLGQSRDDMLQKIIQKKEFSWLPKKDVETAFSHFEKRQTSDEEKVRLTRELLHKVFGAFGSRKLLIPKKRTEEWILRKHLSTRERLPYYREIYERILRGLGKKISILDLGAGVNGFSYRYFREIGFDVNYTGFEATGQFVESMNNYFKNNKIKAKALHLSLFQLGEIKKLIKKTERPRVIFLFKVLDSLEMLKRDCSKELVSAISPAADRTIVSFATESMVKRKKFMAKRTWFLDFLKENFSVLDDFEIGKERYLVFKK
ncbi:MAG TPA: hypothetical protein VJ142_03250 [Candidatus Nanoarchaeia archaeon]|nr:hypothetical protein [Candidatus Nanoarchaeia archaeon]